MKTLLILAIIHTAINVFLCGTRYEHIEDVWIETHEPYWKKLYKMFLIIIVFLLFLLEIELATSIGNYFISEPRIMVGKYYLYIFGYIIYFQPIVFEGEKEKDLYLAISEQKVYSIKKLWFFDVVYRNNKK